MTGGAAPPGGRALGTDDLVLAAATLTADGVTPLDVAAEAARAGGFRGLSLWASSYLAARGSGSRPGDIRARLDDAGPGDPGGPYAEEASRPDVLAAAEALGAGVVTLLLFGTRDAGEDDAAEAFAGVAADAAEHGLRVALEFAPGTAVPDLATAARVTGPVVNGGILVDAWQVHYGPTTLDDLARAPGSRVLAVQVSDGPAQPADDHRWATRHRRLPPGDGQFALAATVDALRAAGCTAPLTVEAFDDERAAALGPAAFARHLGDALRAVRRASRPIGAP